MVLPFVLWLGSAVFLGLAAVQDFKEGVVDNFSAILFLVSAFFWSVFSGGFSVVPFLCVFMLMIFLFNMDFIGGADAKLILGCFLLLPFFLVPFVLVLAIVSVFYGGQEIRMVPFIFMGWLISFLAVV